MDNTGNRIEHRLAITSENVLKHLELRAMHPKAKSLAVTVREDGIRVRGA